MSSGSALRLAALALLWGSSFLWIELALDGLSPVQLTLARLAIGAGLLTVVVHLRGLRLPRDLATWRALLVAAVVANALPYTLFGIGQQSVDSAVAGAINATTPLWTLAVGLAAGAEARPDARRWVGLLVGLAGTVLLLGPWESAGTGTLAGSLACLGAAASYGVAFVYMGRRLVGRGISPLVLSAAQLLAATGLLALAVPVLGREPVTLDASVLGAIVVLGLGGTGLAYVLNYRLIADEGPTVTSTVTYLLPVVAMVLGVSALGEPLSWRLVAGTLVVLVGVGLAARSQRSRVEPALPVPPVPPAKRPT